LDGAAAKNVVLDAPQHESVTRGAATTRGKAVRTTIPVPKCGVL
jgi:hypothetical protein